jgi:hypothetical protein
MMSMVQTDKHVANFESDLSSDKLEHVLACDSCLKRCLQYKRLHWTPSLVHDSFSLRVMSKWATEPTAPDACHQKARFRVAFFLTAVGGFFIAFNYNGVLTAYNLSNKSECATAAAIAITVLSSMACLFPAR